MYVCMFVGRSVCMYVCMFGMLCEYVLFKCVCVSARTVCRMYVCM